MPNYEYRCKECNDVFERYLSLNEYDAPQQCDACGGESIKLISRISFINTGENRPIDSVIGADAERRWKSIYDRKDKKKKEQIKKAKEKVKK